MHKMAVLGGFSHSLRVLVGPAGVGKSERIIKSFIQELRAGGEPLLLLPSSHRVGEVRRKLLFQGEPPGLDTICTIETLLDTILEGTPFLSSRLNAIETQAVVEEVIRRVAGRLRYFGDMSEKWGFSRMVGRFLREAVGWGGDVAPLRSIKPEQKAKDLALILKTYLEVMEGKGIMDEPLSLLKAAELVKQGHSPKARRITHLFVDGFYDFTHAQWALIESLIGQVPRSTFSLLYHSGRPRLFRIPKSLLERLKAMGAIVEEMGTSWEWPLSPLEEVFGGGGVELGKVPELDDRVHLIKGRGRVGEARWVAHEVASLLRGGVRPEEIGVLVRDIGEYRAVLEEAFDVWGIPYRVSQHPALAEHPLVNLGVMLSRTRLEDLPVSRLVSLTLSSFIPLDPLTKSEVLRLVERVQYLVGIERWRERLKGLGELPRARGWILSTLIPALEAIPLRGEGREIIKGLDNALRLLGVGVEGEEVLSHLWEALLSMVRGKELAGVSQFTLEEFLISASGVLRESHYSPPQLKGGVTIMGLLDGRQSVFPHLFFMGLSQEAFPSQVYSDPLLRDADRERINRAYGRVMLPLQGERSLSEDRLLFYIGFTRARETLHLSYSCRDDQGRPLLPSPYLQELLRGLTLTPVQGSPPLPMPLGPGTHFEASPVSDVPLPQAFTPTQLETYAHCPCAFFFRYVLKVEPFQVPMEEALATRIGDLYHEVLQRYGEARRRGEGGGLRENLSLLEGLAREIFLEYLEEGKVGHQELFRAESERHLENLRNFVRWETEQEVSPPLAVEKPLEGEFGGLHLRGKLDRVQMMDGETGIWDYKVSQGYDYRERERKGLLFQPHIYAYLWRQKGGSCSQFWYLFLPRILDRGGGIYRANVSDEAIKGQLKRAIELVKHMKAGCFSPYSKDIGLEEAGGKCRHCLYRLICRREDKVLGW